MYPAFRERAAEVGGHEVEHGKEEHAEGTEALLAVMELKGTDTQAYEDAVEELSSLPARRHPVRRPAPSAGEASGSGVEQSPEGVPLRGRHVAGVVLVEALE